MKGELVVVVLAALLIPTTSFIPPTPPPSSAKVMAVEKGQQQQQQSQVLPSVSKVVVEKKKGMMLGLAGLVASSFLATPSLDVQAVSLSSSPPSAMVSVRATGGDYEGIQAPQSPLDKMPIPVSPDPKHRERVPPNTPYTSKSEPVGQGQKAPGTILAEGADDTHSYEGAQTPDSNPNKDNKNTVASSLGEAQAAGANQLKKAGKKVKNEMSKAKDKVKNAANKLTGWNHQGAFSGGKASSSFTRDVLLTAFLDPPPEAQRLEERFKGNDVMGKAQADASRVKHQAGDVMSRDGDKAKSDVSQIKDKAVSVMPGSNNKGKSAYERIKEQGKNPANRMGLNRKDSRVPNLDGDGKQATNKGMQRGAGTKNPVGRDLASSVGDQAERGYELAREQAQGAVNQVKDKTKQLGDELNNKSPLRGQGGLFNQG